MKVYISLAGMTSKMKKVFTKNYWCLFAVMKFGRSFTVSPI